MRLRDMLRRYGWLGVVLAWPVVAQTSTLARLNQGHEQRILQAAVPLTQDRRVPGEETPIAFISVAEVHRLIREGAEVRFVDVRSPMEYWARHIPGAVSMPVNTLPRRAAEIPRQGLVVLY
jgi:Rhodanese-like domain